MQDLHSINILDDIHNINLRQERPGLFDSLNLLWPSGGI